MNVLYYIIHILYNIDIVRGKKLRNKNMKQVYLRYHDEMSHVTLWINGTGYKKKEINSEWKRKKNVLDKVLKSINKISL